MIFKLALFILANLATPHSVIVSDSDPFPPCEDAAPGAVCVMYDEHHWTITDTEATFAYPTGLCTDVRPPCLLADRDTWRLVSTIDAPVSDVDLGA